MNEFATAEFKALLDSMPRSRVSSPTNTIAHIFRHEHKENFISDWLAFLLNPDEDHRPAGWQSYDGGPGGICIRGRDGRRVVKADRPFIAEYTVLPTEKRTIRINFS